MKSWRLISLLGFLSMLGGGAGCAVETSPPEHGAPAEESTGVDSEMFDIALVNQARLEEAGLRFLGRVWFAQDGYSELYERDDGEAFAFFFARSGTKEAVDTELMPLAGEPLDTYVARAARGRTPRYLRAGGESGPDVLLFEAQRLSSSGAGVGTSREAVVNQFCPKADYDTLCLLRFGYDGSTSGPTWNVFDKTEPVVQTRSGTTFMSAVCADRRGATLEIQTAGGDFRPLFLEAAQGVWVVALQKVGWRKAGPDNCDIIGWCCDYHDVPNTSSVTVIARAGAGSGANFHTCGRTMNRGRQTTSGCLGEPFRTLPAAGFLDVNGRLSSTERAKFCNLTCSKSCANAGPGMSVCMSGCTSSCMAG